MQSGNETLYVRDRDFGRLGKFLIYFRYDVHPKVFQEMHLIAFRG